MAGTCCDLCPPTSCPAGSLGSRRADAGTFPGTLPPPPPAAGELFAIIRDWKHIILYHIIQMFGQYKVLYVTGMSSYGPFATT